MSNAKPAEAATQLATIEREISYTPLAESEPIKLSIAVVMNTLAVKTRRGHAPGIADVAKFMMLCKTRRLNPFASDAYLVGYDSDDGPTFQLITAIQALRKRAETHPQFDGSERGVIVTTKAGELIERPGTMTLAGETLVGGWSKVYRKDWRAPAYETVKLATYSTGKSRWAKDKEGMISKVAEAAALRRAFPSDVGGLYVAEEFDGERPASTVASNIPNRLADLRKRPEPGTKPAEAVVIESGAEPAEDGDADGDAAGGDVADQTADDPAAIASAEHLATETPASVKVFAECREMISKAMRLEDVEAARAIIAGKRSQLTVAQWSQLAMIDMDQQMLIKEAAAAEGGGA